VIGGTAAVIGGGKFANGAVTSGFGYLFNHCAAGTSPECGGTSGSDHDHVDSTIGPFDLIGGGISGLARGLYGLLVSGVEGSLIGIGKYAGRSIAARSSGRGFTAAERAEINAIGSRTGCHTCGTTNPGTKSGNLFRTTNRLRL
jgi:hypothetical protein